MSRPRAVSIRSMPRQCITMHQSLTFQSPMHLQSWDDGKWPNRLRWYVSETLTSEFSARFVMLECGIRHDRPQARIIGGSSVNDHSWPFAVLVRQQYKAQITLNGKSLTVSENSLTFTLIDSLIVLLILDLRWNIDQSQNRSHCGE